MRRLKLALGIVLSLAAVHAQAQTLDAAFAGSYTLTALGAPVGVPTNFGGLTLLAGSSNTLLLGGSSNAGSGLFYTVGITRDTANHITGFTGTATAQGYGANNDGGIAYGPGGVLFYTRYPTNQISQVLPGTNVDAKTTDLGALGISFSVGSLNFVPVGSPGAGSFKVLSYNTGSFYNVGLTPDGSGTYTLSNAVQTAALSAGPEGFAYVPGSSPLFTTPSMLVSNYLAGTVTVYNVNASGDPLAATQRSFITGLTGAEGAFIDPLSGDFLFSTFGINNRIIAVRGFAAAPTAVPEPGSVAFLTVISLTGAGFAARRRTVPARRRA